MAKYDVIVFIGRFEPFHNGHAAVLQKALSLANNVLVLVGSAHTPRTIKNPWTYGEREAMITASFPLDRVSRKLEIRPLRDRLYNEAQWTLDVQRAVADYVGGTTVKVGIIGQDKDASSYYLHEFPQWGLVDVQTTAALSATDIRQYLFSPSSSMYTEPDHLRGGLLMVKANTPAPVFDMLRAFTVTPAYAELVREYEFIQAYKKSWEVAPYPPTFVTTDAVVVHSGHVLLVRRRAAPGKGLWALPGGFLSPGERILDGCLRELREETRLKIPVPVLKGSIAGSAVFDHPDRSLRGRTITHAYHFNFPAGDLPVVKGSDDAEKARWIPIAEALDMGTQMFEDHIHILDYFLARS